MNKRMSSWFDTWCKCVREGYTQSIYDFYSKPSSRKVSIYERICREKSNVRILSATCQFFTVGYREHEQGDGKYTYKFVVETAYNTYTAPVHLHDLHAKGLEISTNYKGLVVVPLYRG